VGALLVCLPWLIYLALTVRGGYIRPGDGRGPWALLGLAVLLAACLLGGLWSYNAGYTSAWKLYALYGILVRKLSLALPGGPVVWWGVAGVLHAAAYLAARARFERVEAPARPRDGLATP
jgi:hypothetical protein